jgi:excisionase family DNA binding protein
LDNVKGVPMIDHSVKRSPSNSHLPGHTNPVYVTPNDAVRLTGIGRTLLYQLIAEGKLKSIKLGGKRLILFTSIEELAQHASNS